MRGDDKHSIKVSDAEFALLREMDTVSPDALICAGAKYRTAKRLRDRNLCAASSPEAPGGAAYKLTARGKAVVDMRLRPRREVDALGHKIDDNALYYVQDARQVVGNCALWWCPQSKGYTCELREAGEYSGREVRSMRDTDVPWPVAAVREVAVQHVRSEGLARLREQRRERDVI